MTDESDETNDKPLPRKIVIKITVLGEGGVGKTSLIYRYTNNTFSEQYLMTIGANFSLSEFKIGEDEINLFLWDIAGQKQFNFLKKAFLKDSMASVVVFSLEPSELGKTSLDAIPNWIQDVREHCGDIPIMLFGNKSDLVSDDDIDHTQLEELVKKYNLFGYCITSAKTGDAVKSSFNKIAHHIYDVNLHKEP